MPPLSIHSFLRPLLRLCSHVTSPSSADMDVDAIVNAYVGKSATVRRYEGSGGTDKFCQ